MERGKTVMPELPDMLRWARRNLVAQEAEMLLTPIPGLTGGYHIRIENQKNFLGAIHDIDMAQLALHLKVKQLENLRIASRETNRLHAITPMHSFSKPVAILSSLGPFRVLVATGSGK